MFIICYHQGNPEKWSQRWAIGPFNSYDDAYDNMASRKDLILSGDGYRYIMEIVPPETPVGEIDKDPDAYSNHQ